MFLRCNDLSASFQSNGDAVEALRDISFESRKGEFLAVIGPSGCGKTTLLRVLAKLLKPAKGAIEFGESGRVLMVFQEEGLFPWMTVLENAAFGMEMQGVPRRERESKARRLLERFSLAGREHSYPHQLSVGTKQRVAVIRCFLSEPSVMLMDEPFAALDAQTRLQLQQELLTLWEQSHQNVVFVTHDMDEAILLSDRILVLSAQPGTITGEFRIPFERPRSPAVTLSPDFLDLKAQLLEKLGLADHLQVERQEYRR